MLEKIYKVDPSRAKLRTLDGSSAGRRSGDRPRARELDSGDDLDVAEFIPQSS